MYNMSIAFGSSIFGEWPTHINQIKKYQIHHVNIDSLLQKCDIKADILIPLFYKDSELMTNNNLHILNKYFKYIFFTKYSIVRLLDNQTLFYKFMKMHKLDSLLPQLYSKDNI